MTRNNREKADLESKLYRSKASKSYKIDLGDYFSKDYELAKQANKDRKANPEQYED